MLKAASHENNYTIEKLNSVLLDGLRVSSSAVRNFLTDGNFTGAEKFLGRPFSISGKVAHGDKLGRTIGFPTANISIHRKLSPILGVYSVLVKLKSQTYNGVCNVGKRPTLGGKKTLLEVFIFDFNEEIYGEYVTVIFKQKCREEKKFESFDELKTQIKKDVEKSRLFFQNNIS